ncbi:Alpha/Beta hydrolase protein [Russula aff. rugulosa BPL654]|nr:Alpha/Beta hydrolase protein [Russula aff. rugulosa BPL654]
MIRLGKAVTLVSLLCATIFLGLVVALHHSRNHARRTTEVLTSLGVKKITFSNPVASEFYVDGTSIPEVNFDVGPSWSGLIPISGAANETRKLFFWFFPPGPEGSLDDLIFWTNGGPGCSSLEGLLQENGPFLWQPGQAGPTQNEWSWTNLSSVLYVEQPIGTGFSQGTPTARNEIDVAEQIVGFLQQFLEIFSELKGNNFYLAGESYAGMYVPYTANYIYENTTSSTLDLNLQGIWLNDPTIGWDVIQSQIAAVSFVQKYEHVFAFKTPGPASPDSPVYFNRADVKAAIHAPADVDWTLCAGFAGVNVFPQDDSSLPSSLTVLPNVIEKSNRSVITHGLADFVYIAEGARIVLQNMTWGGKQGFQKPITLDSFILDDVGAFGSVQTERGLTYVELPITGHMVAEDSPVATLQLMRYLMGFRDSP